MDNGGTTQALVIPMLWDRRLGSVSQSAILYRLESVCAFPPICGEWGILQTFDTMSETPYPKHHRNRVPCDEIIGLSFSAQAPCEDIFLRAAISSRKREMRTNIIEFY